MKTCKLEETHSPADSLLSRIGVAEALATVTHFDYQLSYRRNLPHIQPPGVTLFVTFRLAGSLPRGLVQQWNKESQWLAHLARTNPKYYEGNKHDFERAWFAKFESVLDGATCGPLWLRDERIAAVVADSLRYRDGKVYRPDAFSIMANHVHVVFKPSPRTRADKLDYYPLASIMQSLKGFTAFESNRLLSREREFWAHESFDHYSRNAKERQRILAYVLNNPVKAGCVKNWREWKWNYCRE